MTNPLSIYTETGAKAGQAARRKDMSLVRFHQDWLSRAKRLESPDDARAAQHAYDAAYREASGVNDAPRYFR